MKNGNKEPTRLHHTMKRLSRMLGKYGHIAWETEDLLLQKIVPQLTDDMVIGIDPGDLNRNGNYQKREYLQSQRW